MHMRVNEFRAKGFYLNDQFLCHIHGAKPEEKTHSALLQIHVRVRWLSDITTVFQGTWLLLISPNHSKSRFNLPILYWCAGHS